MKHTIYTGDKQHVVPISLTDREVDILSQLEEYYKSKSRFCKTLIQKNYALEISKAIRKAINL